MDVRNSQWFPQTSAVSDTTLADADTLEPWEEVAGIVLDVEEVESWVLVRLTTASVKIPAGADAAERLLASAEESSLGFLSIVRTGPGLSSFRLSQH